MNVLIGCPRVATAPIGLDNHHAVGSQDGDMRPVNFQMFSDIRPRIKHGLKAINEVVGAAFHKIWKAAEQ